MNSILIMQTASRSVAPNADMAWEKSAQTQVHGVDVAVPAFAQALPAAARTRRQAGRTPTT